MNELVNCQDAVKLLRLRRQSLEQQIAKLQADVEAMKRTEDIILSEQSIQPSWSSSAARVSSELEGSSPTRAILEVLADRPEKSWKATEVAEEMKRRGFKTKSKHFKSVVSATLLRLVKKGDVERIKEEGTASRFKKKTVG